MNYAPIIEIFEDNTDYKRLKHIDIKHQFIRDRVAGKLIDLISVPTGRQVADMLMKALPMITFTTHREAIGLK